MGYVVSLTVSSRIGPMLWDAIRHGQALAPGSAPFWTLFALRGIVIGIALGVASAVHAYRTARQK